MRMGHFVNFKEELKRRTEEAEHVIREYLPEESGFAKTMAEAMNYSMTAGGKRLRPILIRETYELFGGKDKLCEPFMAAMHLVPLPFPPHRAPCPPHNRSSILH